MSEITTIWNQLENFVDVSEEWNPFEEDGLKFLRENSEIGCYPKHVVINDVIGYMIMPGIYYFKNTGYPGAIVSFARGICCARKSAVIGYSISYGLSAEIGVKYLAVDEENIDILKKIHRTMGNGYFVKEFEAYTESAMDAISMEDFVENFVNYLSCDIDNPENCTEDDSGKKLIKSSAEKLVESTAEELMPGIGISDIRVGLKYVFWDRIGVREYEYAYKSGDTLVLIAHNNDRQSKNNRVRKYDLRLLEELTIRRTELLRCGISIDRDYNVIDCKEQKEKQVLTPEAYELFQIYRNCYKWDEFG